MDVQTPARAFLLFCVLVDFQESEVRRIYYPHPETKARHHQNDSVIEVLAPWIEGIQYGDHLDLEVRESEVEIMLNNGTNGSQRRRLRSMRLIRPHSPRSVISVLPSVCSVVSVQYPH